VTLPRTADDADGGGGEPRDAELGATATATAVSASALSRAGSPRLARLTDAYGSLERRLAEPRIRRRIEIAAPVAILGLAAVARLVGLGNPHLLIFDETYYVKEGWSTWQLGYEGEWAEGANERFEAGDPGALSTEADYVVHPPLGKWIIGMAMAVFGMGDPFWWRLPSALAGIALVGLTYAVARGLLRSVAFASLAGFWMAIDGFAIVMSRTALLDGILAVFVLAGAGALLLDRRGSPARTVRALAARRGRFGAALWNRPWIIVAGVLLGAGCATKWSGGAFLALFGLWIVVMEALDRRRAGYRHPWLGTLLTQAPASFVLLVVPALVVYVASYAGWFDGGWGSQLMLERADLRWGGLLAWVPLGLQSLWAYHAQQLGFHVGLTNDHAYQSPAIEWLWLGRPTGFKMVTVEDGSWWITAVPNLLVWYAGVLALGFLLFHVGRSLDRRAAFLLLAVAAGYVPWLLFPDRTIFFFYAIVFLPFLVIGLAFTLQQLVALRAPARAATSGDARTALDEDLAAAIPPVPGTETARRDTASEPVDDVEWRAAAWSIVALLVVTSILVAAWYLPVWYGIPLPDGLMRLRFWPPSWP